MSKFKIIAPLVIILIVIFFRSNMYGQNQINDLIQNFENESIFHYKVMKISEGSTAFVDSVDYYLVDSLTLLITSKTVSVKSPNWSIKLFPSMKGAFFKRNSSKSGYFYSPTDFISILKYCSENLIEYNEFENKKLISVKTNPLHIDSVSILMLETNIIEFNVYYIQEGFESIYDRFKFYSLNQIDNVHLKYIENIQVLKDDVKFLNELEDYKLIVQPF